MGKITRGKLTRAELALWDGKTATYSRSNAAGGTTTGLVIGNEVDILQVFGSGTDRTAATLIAAKNFIGSSYCSIVFAPGAWTIDVNVTVPSNISVKIPAGVDLQVSSGIVLTFSGPVFAESTEWASGSGTISPAEANIEVFATYYKATAAETAAGVTVVNFFYHEGHVYRYGTNTIPGTTDMTAAFQSAWKLKNPYAPADTYLITGTIPIIANQQSRLDNAIINITGTSLEVFTATAVNDWSIRGLWRIVGDNDSAGSTSGSAAGLRITDCMRFHVDAPECLTIKGWGIRVRPGSSTSNRGEKGAIVAPKAHGCYIAFECEAGTGAEYINVLGPVATRNSVGYRVAAGNLNVTGGSIIDNVTGVDLVNGSNHGHGIFSGVQINHNTTAIKANTVTNGHSFVGCHVYQGIIHFNHSTGVVFKGGVVDADEYRFEESDGCGFIDNTMPVGYANTISNNYNASNSFTIWKGNRTLIGGAWNGSLGNIIGVRITNALASSQVFSAANVNATSVIKLDDTANASANQATQTAYDGYSAATGIYTCVKNGDGKVKIVAQLVVSNNAADTGLFQVFLTHSVMGDYYFNSEKISTTSVIFRLHVELPINLTETLKFSITGSGVANNVTVTNSSGTKAQIEGL